MGKQLIWDFWAGHYEQLWVQKYSLGPTRRAILLHLKGQLNSAKKYRILDVGCGTGQLLREIKAEFADHKLELFGIDFSQAMIQRASRTDASIGYRQLDVRDLSYFMEKFDIIICTHSLPYYDHQTRVIGQCSVLLNTGGQLLLAQASQNNLYDQMLLLFVKLSTGKANYPSVESVLTMTAKFFECKRIIKIKERFFMPSIYLFMLTKRIS